MKRILNYSFFIFVILIGGRNKAISQTNLVPNPSFEIDSLCPNNYSQVNYVPPWYSPTQGTPDYYNACSGSSMGTVGVPLNGYGYQNARTGVAYVGIFAYGVSSTGGIEGKEYIQIKLTDSLIMQKKYCASFYVNNAVSGFVTHNFVAITKLGIYISNDTISLSTQTTLPYTPQIQSPANIFLNDTSNWIEISGQYIAHGGEKYLTIGNFNSHTDTMGVVNHNISVSSAYYYIDDVSIIAMPTVNAGRDTTICHLDSVQLGINNNDTSVTYSWQPTVGLSNATISNPMASPTATTTYYLTQTASCGITIDTVTVTLGNCTIGINELKPSDIQIYPNPAIDMITVEFPKNLFQKPFIEIKDIFDRIVYTSNLSSSTSMIDVSLFPRGIYFLQIKTENGIVSRKFAKE